MKFSNDIMAPDDSWFEAFLRDIDNANGPADFDEFARSIQQDAANIELGLWQQPQEQQEQVMTNVADESRPYHADTLTNAITPLTDIPSTFPTRQQLPFGQRAPAGQEGLYEYRSLFADMAPAPQRETSIQTTYAVDSTSIQSITDPRLPPHEGQSLVPTAYHDHAEYGWIFADQAPITPQESLADTQQYVDPAPSIEQPPMLDATELALLEAFSRPSSSTSGPQQPSPSATEPASPPRSDPRSEQQALEAIKLIDGTWNISVRIVLQELKRIPRFSDTFECAKVLRKIWPDQFPDPMHDGSFSKTISLISVEQINVEGKRWKLMDLVGQDHEWRVQVREMLKGMGVV